MDPSEPHLLVSFNSSSVIGVISLGKSHPTMAGSFAQTSKTFSWIASFQKRANLSSFNNRDEFFGDVKIVSCFGATTFIIGLNIQSCQTYRWTDEETSQIYVDKLSFRRS